MTVAAYSKHLPSFFLLGFVVDFLFFIQLAKSAYYPPRFELFYGIVNKINEHN